ncbi:glycoside hydrolase family 5 protein [Nocardiopsis sp. NPDC101807]|uniref:glycoside hydrolase family 5 protein n=1 Tax=Nocardiopsis sp. NPDC101807 TaxID=3364339 RepID=UPI00381773C7
MAHHPPTPARTRRTPAGAALVGALLLAVALLVVAGAHGQAGAAPAPVGQTRAPSGPGAAAGPADTHGQLTVCGVKLCDSNGDPVQLTGMSSHGLQWYSDCLTDGSLDALAHDWNADVLRVSMYIQEGGYETDPRGFTDRVHELIEEATARGMYVIVDWHMLTPGDPRHNTERARTFFSEIASVHADKDNVLYEIANEPNGVSWDAIKDYAEEIIPVIRAESPEAVVLVGTRAWSSLGMSEGSDHTEITADPVDADNIMYVFHFYAATHGSYREAFRAAAQELPLFVTEFGTQQATGDGPNDFASAQAYLDLMEEEQISWVNWNFSDDFRSGAVFETGTCAAGGPWTGAGSLKPAGEWIRDRIRESGAA